MANLYYTINGVTLIPALPVERSVEPVEDVLLMAAGNERAYHRGEIVTLTLTDPGADEATWTIWKAVPRNAAVTVVEPDGTTLTARVTAWSDPITETQPTSGEGTATATGTATRSLTLTLRGRVTG